MTRASLRRCLKKDEIVVVYDDIDINIGTVKCSFDRGAGGHNGVQSIIDHVGTKAFARIRVGVRPVHEELLPRIAPPDGLKNTYSQILHPWSTNFE
jgi:peptidyl-tRNA hydrolase